MGERELKDALAICARLREDLRNMQQSLGLERAEAHDVALSAAASELHVIQADVDELTSLLEGLQQRDQA